MSLCNKRQRELIFLGRMVRKIRIKKGFSQEAFADEAQLDRSYMGRIERGENNPTVTTVYRIARALRVSPRLLFLSR